jgi:HPt (histidine-containing phosphotransfer) domain-containing protein
MTMDPKLPVLSRDEALERLEGDVELWGEIRDIWLEDVGNLINGVDKALDTRNADGLRRAAHALKGASANVGATRVAGMARMIELSALAADWPMLTEYVVQLRLEIEEARTQLEKA